MGADRRSVLLVCHAFGPQSIAGTEIHTYHLARHLSRRWRVAVLHGARDPGAADGSLSQGQWRGVPVFTFVQNYPYRPLAAHVDPTARRAFETALDALSPAVVHLHHLSGLSLDLPQAARARGIPTVMTLHDYHLLCPSGGQLSAHPDGGVCQAPDAARCAACFEGWRSREGALESAALSLGRLGGGLLPAGWPFRLYRALPGAAQAAIKGLNRPRRHRQEGDVGGAARRLAAAREALGAVDVVLSPSRDLLGRFAAAGVALPQGRHLANGVPDPHAPPGERAPRPPADPPTGGPVRFIHLGTLAPHKGIDLMVEAARQLDPDQARLTIHGPLSTFPAFTAPLARAAEAIPALSFAGGCDPDEVAGIMAGAHALVMAPRWPENAPLTVLEAQAAGRPVIAPAIGGLPEQIRDGVDGLLYPPGDAAALAAALRRFAAVAPLRRRLTAGVRPPPTAADHAEAVSALYDALLSGGML